MREFIQIAAVLFGIALILCLSASPMCAASPVEIVIEGPEGEALKNVEAALTLPPGLVRDGKVDRLWLERFAGQAEQTARTALEPFGYYRAEVRVETETRGEEAYRLRITVDPGDPVRVAEVQVAVRGAGAAEKDMQEMVSAFPLHKGDILLQPSYEQAKGALQARAEDLGYRDARFTVHEIRIDETLSRARIVLVLETGERHRFGEATIAGAPDYPDAFLRRYLAFTPGEVYSPTKLAETQRNFRNSERFRGVLVTPEKTASPDTTVPVIVQLAQGPRQSLRVGVGYGTDTGARFSTRYRHLNLFQRGHEFTTNFFISERFQGLVSAYIVPSVRDFKSSTSVQVNLQQEDLDAYSSRQASVELARNHRFGPGMLGTAAVGLRHEEFDEGDEDSRYFMVLPELRFTHDRYDNTTRPRRGFHYDLGLRGTHQALGSNTALLQVIADGNYLLPLPWRLTLHTRAAAGVTILSDPLSDIPPSLRFFTGGDESVRGYAYKSLAPKDSDGDLAGGKHLLCGSIEIERDIFDPWSVSAFYDAGNAFDSFTSVRLHQGAGIGVHYYTPVGAVNLSLARQIAEDDPSWRVHFTVGFQW